MDTLKLFLGPALLDYLPWGALNALLCFLSFKWLLKYRRHAIAILAMLLVFAAAVAGLVYGSLRFGGVITFADDPTYSFSYSNINSWFDAFYQDAGFRFAYPCGTALIGFIAAAALEWKVRIKLRTSQAGVQ